MNGKHLGNSAECQVGVEALFDYGKKKSNDIGRRRSRRHNCGCRVVIIIIIIVQAE